MDEYAFARDMLRRDIAAHESLQRFRQECAAAATGGLPHRDDAPRYAPGAIAGAEPAPSPRVSRHVHWSQAPDCRRGGNVRRLIMQEAHTLARRRAVRATTIAPARAALKLARGG